MKNILLLCSCVLLLAACNSEDKNGFEAIDFIPADSKVILHTKAYDSLVSHINKNKFLSAIESNTVTSLIASLGFTKNLNISNDVLICLSEVAETPVLTFITKIDRNFKDNTVYDESKTMGTIAYNASDKIHTTVVDSIFIAATSEVSLKNTLATIGRFSAPSFDQLREITFSDTTIFIDIKNSDDWLTSLLPTPYLKDQWLAFETIISNKAILLNGTAIGRDSTELNRHELIPQIFDIASVLPENPTYFENHSFSEFSKFNSIHLNSNETSGLLNSASEFATVQYPFGKLIAFTLDDFDNDFFQFSEVLAYRDQVVFENDYPVFNKSTVAISGKYHVVLDNHVIYSDEIDTLKEVINHFLNQNTLENTVFYKKMIRDLNSDTHQIIIQSTDALAKQFGLSENKNRYPFINHQLIFEKNFTQLSSIIPQTEKQSTAPVTQTQRIKLDHTILSQPVFVKNHRDNSDEILIQDSDFNLLLLNKQGNVLWKKQLDSQIQGDVTQVDAYKNNKLQYAFCTAYGFYILDRNGNHIDNFPIRFQDPLTQPLAVFDYDNNKGYRFLLTQNKALFMLNRDGKRVKGFKFKKANHSINTLANHIRIANKDYIVFGAKDKLMILDRTGTPRLNIDSPIACSGNRIYKHKNAFVTTDTQGHIVTVNTNGTVNKTSAKLNPGHYFNATNAIAASVSENTIRINNTEISLDFGHYTPPVVYYRNKKYYISTTDLQAKKVYVFDETGELLPKFPVFGATEAHFSTNKRHVQFIVKGEDHELLVYHIN